MKINSPLSSVCIALSFFAACSTKTESPQSVRYPIHSLRVNEIGVPAAGNYPQGMYKYPYRTGSLDAEIFTQTLEWLPAVEKTFAKDTEYTAILTLDPAGSRHTFKETLLSEVRGLPADGIQSITSEISGDSMVVKIVYEKTAAENAAPLVIFSDEFNGTVLDAGKWELCPEWDRQGRSSWRDDMVELRGGNLVVKLRSDPVLGRSKSSNSSLANNWVRAGGIRSVKKNSSRLFDNTFGFYEARIKFPQVRGTWGAFWLMSMTASVLTDEGVIGTEIDIVETIHNERGRYNAAIHWNGYGEHHKGTGSGDGRLPVDIYDGGFHVFALDWSPSEYVFYVDGIEYWRVDGGSRFNNSGINQNPNYIKFTTEGADWAGTLPENFTEDEMLVDYIRVYNQPQILN